MEKSWNDEDKKAFGERLQQARVAKFGDSRGVIKQITDELGLSSSSHWSQYESGIKAPRVEAVAFLADYLGVDVAWLLTGKGDMLGGVKKKTPNQLRAHRELGRVIDEYMIARERVLSDPAYADAVMDELAELLKRLPS